MHISTQTISPRHTARTKVTLSWMASALAATLLGACGGGGGGTTAAALEPTPNPEPTTPATLSAAQFQGRWQTANGITPAHTAIVLPGAPGSTELWLLASDLSSLSRLQVSASGTDAVSASGQTYSLPSSPGNPGQSATYSGTANLKNTSLSLNAGVLLLTRSDTLTGPSSLNDVVGSWRASVGSQSATLSVILATDGALNGSSSTGCSYSGTLTARSDASAYNASLSETCSTSTNSFVGIATYRAAQGSTAAALTLAMASTDAAQTQALVMNLIRP